MHRVFISYRRADSEEMARKIHDRLSASLQTSLNPNPVFLDTSDLHAGAELRTEILKILNDVDVLVVIIGTQWLTTTLPGQEQPRIFDPVDFLHREVRYGLSEWAARDMNVIPVLVNGAKMPLESQLPGSLRELAEISGFTLTSGEIFGSQMERLTDDIRRYIQEADKKRLVRGLTIVREYRSTTEGKDVGTHDTVVGRPDSLAGRISLIQNQNRGSMVMVTILMLLLVFESYYIYTTRIAC